MARPPERVRGDALVLAFESPFRRDRVPSAAHLRKDAGRLVVAEPGATTWLEGHGTAAPRVLLVCVGSRRGDPPPHGWSGRLSLVELRAHLRARARRLGAAIEHACHEQDVRRVVLAALPEQVDVGCLVEGLLLRAHANLEFRPDALGSSVEQVTICVPKAAVEQTRACIDEVVAVAEAVNAARDLVDLPMNVGTPAEIVSRVEALAQAHSVKVKTVGASRIRALSMGLVEAVAAGSSHPPCILTLEHDPGLRDAPTIAFVGKGVLHDLGGYNLKTTPQLHRFTDDKAGAAAVIGALLAIARLQLPVRVLGVAPLVENCIDAGAFKPGDVLTAMNGSTVYVESTDAEGRLVLADCLTWIAAREPAFVVDVGTLTEGAHVALGEPFAALFANDDDVRDLLLGAGFESGELLWPMPIHAAHDHALEHHLANVRNAGAHGGGASVAAAFLRRFVDYPWGHVDMAGHGSRAVEGEDLGAGATGFGTRLLVEATRQYAARHGARPEEA